MRWLVGSIASCAVFCAVALGSLLPLRDDAGIQYVYVWPGLLRLLVGAALAALALTVLYFCVLLRVQRVAPEHLESARSGLWLAPMTTLGCCVVGVLPAAPGVGELASALGYFFYDLRWWWVLTIALFVAMRIDRLTGAPVGRRLRAIEGWSPHARLFFFDTVLLVGVMLCATASTRYLRFDPGLHGDEPKYIRYGEVWYQGGGLEVSSKKLFREVPLDADSQIGRNFVLLGRAIIEESRALVADVRSFLSNPRGFQWNRGQRIEGFVTGKRGGKYQIYLPGVSFLLFPGYFIDRHVLALRGTQAGEFPAELVMTNLTMLFLYGLCAVALFRLLRHALGSDTPALFWAAAAMLSLPAAAFAFQFYPEVPALLVVILITTYVWFHASSATWFKAAAAGLAAGGIVWFHPRFLLVSIVLIAAGAMKTAPGRSRQAFSTGAALGLLSMMAFAYRVTGSWTPTALWDAPGGESGLYPAAVPLTLSGYALHRTWGMAPHSPLLLGAVPGLAVLARRSPGHAIFVPLITLSLVVPAAAHTLSAAGGTPGRLIVAVVPLLIWPVAVLVRRFWSVPAVRMATIVGVVLSLEAGVTYNRHHIKTEGSIHATGVSGWRPNLAFPIVSGGGWNESSANVALFVIVLGAVAVATMTAFMREQTASARSPGTRHRWTPAATVALVVLLSAGATAFNHRWVDPDYLIDDTAARREAAAALVEHEQCRVCFATRDPAIDWRWMEPNGTDRINIETSVSARTATIHAFLDGGHESLRFGRMRAEFGDGSSTPWTGIVGEREIVHTYEKPGQYAVIVWLQLRNGEMRADRRTLTIAGLQ